MRSVEKDHGCTNAAFPYHHPQNTSLDRSRFADFSCLATVYKRLQPGTHHIMMAQSQYRSWPITADMVRLCGMIHHMAQHHTGLRLASLRLSRFAFELQIDCGVQNISSASVSECLLHRSGPVTVKADVEPGFYRLQDFMAVCSSLPCSTIFMANCVVRLACCCFFPGFIGRERRICVEIRIPTARLPVRADFQWVLWDALEAVMLPPSDGELQKLSARMKSLEKNESNLKKVVCAMLCAMQSADRRPSTHYRGKKWCVDGLHGLQLEKLSSVTQHFLLQLHKMAAHSLSLAW
ncbi:uncharacterized protein LOC129595802 [Paramacrobiotus metropolitanus]|uniref:uncharacterized protein LOC129595802 n=1 Tax=Paramacrobiotus metropolitanus TaxID=2943436 RepID=UPI002445E21A|nr:uncharacterized protein LOC129595802 [Paramacrobiotus metropolitanus]